MRTIYAKIFLWFWLTIAAVTVSLMLITVIGGVQPLGRRWLTTSLDMYGRSAVDFYQQGGTSALRQYIDDIDRSGLKAALIDPQGNDILGRGLPPLTARVLAEARRTGESRLHTRLIWAGASVVHTPQGDFIFVVRMFPLRGFWTPEGISVALLRWGIALLSAGLLCWLIARHITAPVRTLQVAARRIADGDLSVRATPGIPPRNDELADLAHDFDRMADRMQSLMHKQQELLGDISHELRSPMARMAVSLELARRGDREALERMQTDLDRLDALIEQVLTLTRLQLQEGRNLNSTVNLRTIVESVVADCDFEGKATAKSVVLTHADACWVKGDAALLRSCVENVVRNAVRYTAPDTSVDVSLRNTGGAPSEALLSIQDRGPGVPPEALPKLFEAFYRVSPSRERESGGTGLGLSIAQKVASLHQGRISARNREQGGLVVEIRLPATVPAAAKVKA